MIVDWHTGADLLNDQVTAAAWTVLIAAAGRGTRLGFDRPKILYPVGGLTILERLVRLFNPFCGEFVFVLSPEGAPAVEPDLARLVGKRGRIAIQPSPNGMAGAVQAGAGHVRTPNVAVVWGDQFALKPASLDFCMRLLEGRAAPAAVCPTLLRPRPYIHFVRDRQGGISEVLQQREGDLLPEEGESDSGVFFFRTASLQHYLPQLFRHDRAIGSNTREVNFLPIFPLMDSLPGALITPRIMTESESVGVNTAADARYLETQDS